VGTPTPQPGKWLVGLATVLVLAAVLGFVLHRASAPPTHSTVASPIGNNIGQGLRLKGITEATHARAILAPLLSGQQVGVLTITKLLPPGARVRRGDVLVEFDRQAQIRDTLDKQAEYNKLVDQASQERAKEDAARAKDETELQQAESELSKAQLEMQKAEILSRIDVEKAEENLEQAKAVLQQLRETFELKRKAASAAIQILEIQRDRTRQNMLHAQKNAELMQVRSPIEGVVVLNTIWKEGKMGEVQDGDQVRPGVPFMEVVDPSRMEVVVQVNQEDFLSLKVGQSATVRLDAYPEMVFSGKLEQISPIARNGRFSARVRTLAAVFSVEGSDPRLMPDLSAAVDVDSGNHSLTSGGSQ
jgi:HlyD family secretion protein